MKLYQCRFYSPIYPDAKTFSFTIQLGINFWSTERFLGIGIGLIVTNFILEFYKKELPKSFIKDDAGKDLI